MHLHCSTSGCGCGYCGIFQEGPTPALRNCLLIGSCDAWADGDSEGGSAHGREGCFLHGRRKIMKEKTAHEGASSSIP